MKSWLALFLSLALAPLSLGDVRWVNPVTGSDSAPGTETEPMRTVSAALDGLASSGNSHVIVLAEGIYDQAGGEAFPWRPFPSVRFEGAGHGTRVRLSAGDDALIGDGASSVSMEGLRVEGTGVQRLARLQGGGTAQVRRCKVEDCGDLISQLGGLDRQMQITVEDSHLVGCGGVGVNSGYASSPAGFTDIRRCVFDRCISVAGGAVFLDFGSNVRIYDTIVMRGTGTSNCIGNADLLSGCTIAHNAGPVDALEFTIRPRIENSILAFNGASPSVSSWNQLDNCLVEDGSGDHIGLVLTGDPLFVDGLAGDVRLRAGSPAVDVGSVGPNQGAGSTDATGRTRDVDGNLDQQVAVDLGAMELRTLDRAPGAGFEIALGQPYSLELTAPRGSFFHVAFSRGGLAAAPTPTLYGDLWLLPGATRVAFIAVQQACPRGFDLPLQGGSALIGARIGYQGVTRSLVAPNFAAWTNPLELTIVAP